MNLLCHSKTDARFMQDGRKVVWSIPYVSVASFFPSFKQNFIAYRSSKVFSRPDCIFEIHQLWQSDFSRVYSNCCCSCSFERGQSSHKMYSNNIVNFQESMTILNACTKKSYWIHLVGSRRRSNSDSSVCRSPQENVAYELSLISSAVSGISCLSDLNCFRDGRIYKGSFIPFVVNYL